VHNQRPHTKLIKRLKLCYKNKKFIENNYSLEILFIWKTLMQDKKIQRSVELIGIPITQKINHRFLLIYSKELMLALMLTNLT